MNNREYAQKIFMEGISGVLPGKIINSVISVPGPVFRIKDLSFRFDDFKNIYVIGAGKASAAMAHYTEVKLKERITGGHIVVKYGHSCKLRKIKVTEAGHPVPDKHGFRATAEIKELASNASESDLVICLISGGGSALMADLPEGLLPEELYIVNNLLVRCGAPINEINCVRKHLSEIKGGQLSRIVWPAILVTIILSDVPGNPLDVIASGPTVPDPSTFSQALDIIEKYGLVPDLTAGVLRYLREGAAGMHPETPKEGDPIFSKTHNILAGTNSDALLSAANYAADCGFDVKINADGLTGDVDSAARLITGEALNIRNDKSVRKPACLLYGGETTVKVNGDGLGGRNQHLALTAALRLENMPGITLLSGGTDGNDGPTNAAGAVVDAETACKAREAGIDPEKYLADFDSYNFFRAAGGHIITGPTFTNVMDMAVVLVE